MCFRVRVYLTACVCVWSKCVSVSVNSCLCLYVRVQNVRDRSKGLTDYYNHLKVGSGYGGEGRVVDKFIEPIIVK